MFDAGRLSDAMDPHWQRTLWAMLSVQFITSSAFSIVPPVIPLILPTLGVHSAGAMRTWAGVLVGVTPLAAALMSPQWGRLSDRIDRRWIILISCGAAAVCTVSMSLSTTVWELLALRFVMGLFGGHVAAGLAIVSSGTPTDRMGWALGWLATGQLSGTLIGPLMGGAMADAFASFRAPFLLAGGAVLFVAGAVALVPPPSVPPCWRRSAEELTRNATRAPLPGLRSMVIVLFLVQCSIMITQPAISLHVRELVGDRSNLATFAGLAFSVVGLSGLVAAPVLGMLGDKVGQRRLLFFVIIMAAVFVLPQAYTGSYHWFVIERFTAGLFLCSMIPIANSLVGKTIPATERGKAYGATSGAAFLGAFVGPVSGGMIGAHFGLRAVFVASSAILMLNAAHIGLNIWPGRRVVGET